MKALFLSILFFPFLLQAAEMEDQKFDEKITVDGTELVLNGLGLRKVTRMGFPIKVYVGGLYVAKKSSDANAIVNSEEPKRIVMAFVRSVDRNSLNDAYRKGWKANCVVDCKNTKLFGEIKKIVKSVGEDDRTVMDFYKDKVVYQAIEGKTEKVELVGEAYVKNLMALYIGKEPPSEEFKSGMLGK